MHKRMSLVFDASHLSGNAQEKSYIARVSGKKKYYVGNTYKDGFITAKTKSFGTFEIAQDYTEPKITPHNFESGQSIVGKKKIQIKIEDKGSGIRSYKANINEAFALMEYDYKTKLLTFNLEDLKRKTLNSSPNTLYYLLELTVTDNVGNATYYKAALVNKPE